MLSSAPVHDPRESIYIHGHSYIYVYTYIYVNIYIYIYIYIFMTTRTPLSTPVYHTREFFCRNQHAFSDIFSFLRSMVGLGLFLFSVLPKS